MAGRIASDAKDRGNIQQKLEICIDPLNSDNHPDGIVNIVTDELRPILLNVVNSVAMGKEQMKQFEKVGQKLSMSLCQTKWLPYLSPRNVSSWDQRIALTLTSSTRESWD